MSDKTDLTPFRPPSLLEALLPLATAALCLAPRIYLSRSAADGATSGVLACCAGSGLGTSHPTDDGTSKEAA